MPKNMMNEEEFHSKRREDRSQANPTTSANTRPYEWDDEKHDLPNMDKLGEPGGPGTGFNYTFEGTPNWYGGKNGAVKQLMEIAARNHNIPYQPYEGVRSAGFSRLQNKVLGRSQNLANEHHKNDLYQQSNANIQNAGNTLVHEKILPDYLKTGRESINNDISDYMNPYQKHVTDNL
jgi:hypothetical protein